MFTNFCREISVLFSRTTPTEGIYAAEGALSSGYYDNTFSLYGWNSSTSLILNINGGANGYMDGITSCEFDGTPVTMTSSTFCYLPTIATNIDHTITFTVASGRSPTITLNSSQGRLVTKAIFNK